MAGKSCTILMINPQYSKKKKKKIWKILLCAVLMMCINIAAQAYSYTALYCLASATSTALQVFDLLKTKVFQMLTQR